MGGRTCTKRMWRKEEEDPLFIGPHESNRWKPTNHGTTAQQAVLPWSGTTANGAVLPLGRYYRTLKSSTPALRQRFCGSRGGSSHGTTARAVLPLPGGTTAKAET